jgi:hypothetical protein
MAVASRLFAVIEPIDGTVIAVRRRAAAYSGVQSGGSAVAQYSQLYRIVHAARTRVRLDSGFE